MAIPKPRGTKLLQQRSNLARDKRMDQQPRGALDQPPALWAGGPGPRELECTPPRIHSAGFAMDRSNSVGSRVQDRKTSVGSAAPDRRYSVGSRSMNPTPFGGSRTMDQSFGSRGLERTNSVSSRALDRSDFCVPTPVLELDRTDHADSPAPRKKGIKSVAIDEYQDDSTKSSVGLTQIPQIERTVPPSAEQDSSDRNFPDDLQELGPR